MQTTAFASPSHHRSSPDAFRRDLRLRLADAAPGLRARALRLCRNPSDAEDLLQDTIERALRFEASFEPGTNLKAWLHQILFSVFVSRCRRLRRERRALDVLSSDPCAWLRDEVPQPHPGLSRSLESAIEALPQQFAAVIRLVDIGERSYRDAADQLGVPVGTVMSRLFRGRRLLVSALGGSDVATPAAEAVELQHAA
jgi:RNA polymerase sigma-70 factor (ECF subfamily)